MEYSTNIRKKDGGYQYIITYKHNGKWKQKSKQGFEGAQEARDAMMEMIPLLKKQVKENTVSAKVTLEAFAKIYLDHLKLYREPTTITTIKYSILAFGNLNKKELHLITNRDIQNEIDNMVLNGLKGSTINRSLTNLKTILRAAKDEFNLLTEIPTFKLKIKIDKKPDIKKTLSSKEVETILNDFKKRKYYPVIFIALKTGMRIGEIMGLCWEDIDFDNNQITVKHQWKIINGKYDFGSLKTKNSYRDIPLPSSLKSFLLPLKSSGRIIRQSSTKSMINGLNKALNKYNITIHTFRHTYVTTLVASGLDIKTISTITGHDIKMVMEIYSHYSEEMKSKASNIINEIM